MSSLRATVGIVLLSLLIVPTAHTEEVDTCPYPEGRTIEDLAAALAAHAEWLEREGRRNPDVPGRGNFCNADLRQANLQGANLRSANLEGANLVRVNLLQADLEGANLLLANLEAVNLLGANLRSANLKRANLALASLEAADLAEANLEGASLGRATLEAANLSWTRLERANLLEANLLRANLERANLLSANLEAANLNAANLERANLRAANLEGAYLEYATLGGANLRSANLVGVNLFQANLEGASLIGANLEGASLVRANLERANLALANLEAADLAEASLQRAVLDRTALENARFFRVDLSEARYQPASAPAQGHLLGLEGLQSITFCRGEGSGLVQLRQALKSAGLRELEREATYTLENLRTDYALAQWNGIKIEGCENLERDRWAAIEGLFRLIFFELTTDYGLAYGRPILILLGLIFVFALVFYLPVLFLSAKGPDHDSGIYRIWPKGRIKRYGERFEPADDEVVERLKARGISALGWACYFSVVSAFHLGWRDLNVGTWISRIQPREYALRAKGWPRVVSGVQSLISVYLIAMWALTYFGRPFE